MTELLRSFMAQDFMPHGMCYFWMPEILWMHVISDLLTMAAYFSIPLCILLFLRRRSDVNFPMIGWLFAAFILLCGSTHAFAIWVVWNPDYGYQGLLKAVTALVSVATAVVVWRLLPAALKVPTQQKLEREVEAATAKLRETNNELEKSNEELQSFVSIASHDLKEPLRTLVSFSQLLEEDLGDDVSEDVRSDLHHIIGAARQMRTLVQDLLDLTRTSRGEVRLQQVYVDECIDEALTALEAQIDGRRPIIERDAMPTVYGDKTLLTHIYQNLISNAIKFSKPDETPRIHLTCDVSHGDSIVLGVKDHGIGIAPEWTSKIFEAFERLHSRDQYEGAGIGLAICRRAVERMQGRIWVEAVENEGSHFRFTIGAGSERVAATEIERPMEPTLAGHRGG